MLTPQQIEGRRKGIGGSDAAALCGLSPFKTPLHVYMEKLGLIEADSTNAFEGSRIWGNYFERIIAEHFKEKNNKSLHYDYFYQHTEKDVILFANCDAAIIIPKTPTAHFDVVGILEVKTTDKENAWRWGEPGTDEFPDEYKFQCAHYAMVTGVQIVHVAVLIGGNDYREYVYYKNDALESLLLEKELDFWKEFVERKIPPPPICEEDCRLLYYSSNATKIVASNEIEQSALELKAVNETLAHYEEQKSHLKMKLMDYMRDNDTLVTADDKVLVTWKRTKEISRFDTKRFKEECPDLYRDYCKEEKSSRVFLIKK